MSIPLDRLYHYIESIAKEMHDNTIIYRFYPHGSKNINHLTQHSPEAREKIFTSVELVCHDQEPLCYDFYKNVSRDVQTVPMFDGIEKFINYLNYTNLRFAASNIYDKCLLLHSEKNSNQVAIYSQDQYVPVYYWAHAVIALDWYRYAKHINLYPKKANKKFLVYNRDWTGTREYRLKLADFLVDYQLVNQCQTSCSFISTQGHYTQYKFANALLKPKNHLEDYFKENNYPPTSSADFSDEDYKQTDIELVLETLFDDSRHHLTEKSLRPIALGQPFISASTAGSLEYLKSYGFKTFGSLIDETYDTIQDPYNRLKEIVKLMSTINQLSNNDYCELIDEMNKIALYNKQHFYSDGFFDQVITEFKNNLQQGLAELLSTNTYSRCINLRKKLHSNKNYTEWRASMLSPEEYQFFDRIYQLALNLNQHHQ